MFEWVDMVSEEHQQQQEEEKPNKKDSGFREEFGFSRIVNALHTHMWEGMIRVSKPISTETIGTVKEDDGQGEDYSALGAPPLPNPRPFIPIVLEFPETFLPSIPRNFTTSTTSIDSLPTSTLITTAFEDDFSPFSPPLSTSTFPTISPSSFAHAAVTSPRSSNLPSTDSTLSLTDSQIILGGLDEDEQEGEGEAITGDEDLENLLAKLMEFKQEQQGLGLEERRDRVEQLMKGMNIGEW